MRGWGGEVEEGKRRRGCPSLYGVWGYDTRLSCRICAYANMSKSHGGHQPILPTGEAPMLFVMNEGEKCISFRCIQISRVLSTTSPSYNPLAPEPFLSQMNLYEVYAQKQLKLCFQKDGKQRRAVWKCLPHSEHTRKPLGLCDTSAIFQRLLSGSLNHLCSETSTWYQREKMLSRRTHQQQQQQQQHTLKTKPACSEATR